jgi:hypothetical protein
MKLTPEQIEKNVEAYRAVLEGRRSEVEWSEAGSEWYLFCPDFPVWTSGKGVALLRLKPQPKLRPWRAEEVPVGALIRKGPLGGAKTAMILSVSEKGKLFFIDENQITYNYLDAGIMSCEHSLDHGKTWLPCGVMEEVK